MPLAKGVDGGPLEEVIHNVSGHLNLLHTFVEEEGALGLRETLHIYASPPLRNNVDNDDGRFQRPSKEDKGLDASGSYSPQGISYGLESPDNDVLVKKSKIIPGHNRSQGGGGDNAIYYNGSGVSCSSPELAPTPKDGASERKRSSRRQRLHTGEGLNHSFARNESSRFSSSSSSLSLERNEAVLRKKHVLCGPEVRVRGELQMIQNEDENQELHKLPSITLSHERQPNSPFPSFPVVTSLNSFASLLETHPRPDGKAITPNPDENHREGSTIRRRSFFEFWRPRYLTSSPPSPLPSEQRLNPPLASSSFVWRLKSSTPARGVFEVFDRLERWRGGEISRNSPDFYPTPRERAYDARRESPAASPPPTDPLADPSRFFVWGFHGAALAGASAPRGPEGLFLAPASFSPAWEGGAARSQPRASLFPSFFLPRIPREGAGAGAKRAESPSRGSSGGRGEPLPRGPARPPSTTLLTSLSYLSSHTHSEGLTEASRPPSISSTTSSSGAEEGPERWRRRVGGSRLRRARGPSDGSVSPRSPSTGFARGGSWCVPSVPHTEPPSPEGHF